MKDEHYQSGQSTAMAHKLTRYEKDPSRSRNGLNKTGSEEATRNRALQRTPTSAERDPNARRQIRNGIGGYRGK